MINPHTRTVRKKSEMIKTQCGGVVNTKKRHKAHGSGGTEKSLALCRLFTSDTTVFVLFIDILPDKLLDTGSRREQLKATQGE